MVLPTTIKISFKVRNLLKKLRKKEQSYNDYIFELIQEKC
jgi:predicted CopG family antitoxin